MKEEKYTDGWSRREFFRNATIGAAGLAALGTLGACSPSGSNAEPEAEYVEIEGTSYEVINCNFLILGAGNSAMTVAAQALAEGQNVTIVDKGLYRHSGTSGMSWDAFCPGIIPDDPASDGFFGPYFQFQANGTAMRNALDFDPEPNKYVYMINNGQTLPDRNEDGSVADYSAPGWCQSQFDRHEMDQLRENQRATVYDRTMITDLIIQDGRCLGAVGLHIPTGELKVFRSPVTVATTGGCTWIYGWFSVAACTIGTSDNTADVDMAAFRHGAGIGDAEYAQYDIMSSYPLGLAVGFGSGVCGDAQEAHAIVDANGDLVFAEDDDKVADRIYFNQQMGRVIVGEGRGTENGGVYINVGNSHLRYGNERNKALLKKFGVDVENESIEALPEMYEHGGNPVIDEKMMTEFEGLFCARGAGTVGENGGTMVHFNRFYGPYTAHCAVEYLQSTEKAPEIDWSQVAEEQNRLNEIRTRESSDGVRPHIVRQSIQKACKQSLGVYRTTEDMETAISELERIRNEEIPNMAIIDKSPIFNKEWKEAIEAYNMLDIAEISVRASLEREETRGMYLRAEFPERDDENWACMLVCRDNNGTMEFEKKEMPRSSW